MTKPFQPAFTILLGVLLLSSCGNTPSGEAQNPEGFTEQQLQTQEQTWNEIMAIHDDIMPQVSDMNRTAGELKSKLEAENALTEEEKDEIQTAIEDLDSAEEAMFEWMNQLQQPRVLQKSKTHEEIMAYFEKLDQEIKQIKLEMETSLQQGKSLLEENNQN